MTLTTRLLLFFLSMLALVLIGFSVALYLVADNYLHEQVVDRVNAVLTSLAAVVESDDGGLEWEPASRRLNLNFSALGDQVVWLVEDGETNIVDRSEPAAEWLSVRSNSSSYHRVTREGIAWQVAHRLIHADDQVSHVEDDRSAALEDAGSRIDSLTISAAMSLSTVHQTLRRLAGVLIILMAGIWLVALVAGQSICQRALRPVSEMADATRSINAGDLAQRLPILRTGDQLEELNCAFNDLLDRLQESFERQRRFTSDASHQLRTPLTTILGQVEVALRRDRSQDEYCRVLTTVQHSASHLARLVESLLFLARNDADSQALSMERIDLTTWLPNHLQTWATHDRSADIHLRIASKTPCTALVQPQLLGELLNILLDNACKYSDPQTAIEVKLTTIATVVEICVEDRGWGIAEADIPRLFTPFCRSEEVRRRGVDGVGLGLSIAARLAKSFGGQLRATSRPGHGSCFLIQLIRDPD